VELLVVITILGVLAAIVLFNISGVSASAACNAMKTDGATIQSAADLYYNNTGNYPDTVADKPSPLAGEGVDITKLKTANLLHQSPPATEAFTYKASPNGTVHGQLVPDLATCRYN
jgi:type II secretory pathway pseudopilin PulG